MHSHPLFGVVWSDLREVPPILDQSSALGGGGDLVLVDEFDGTVDDPNKAAAAITAMGDAELALLAGHGVFVLGSTVRAVHQRGVALEQRCQRAWYARALSGGPMETFLPQQFLDFMTNGDGNGFHGFWEAAVRQELRADPSLLEGGHS
jgi:ribulose-5-phosphate 4-epimerase/fuculose-1-phosphate aldolase